MSAQPIQIQLASALAPAFIEQVRYRLIKGGRGSSKSHAVAAMALVRGYEKKRRILCTRELQTSIRDSIFRLLCDKIDELKLPGYHYNESSIWH